VLKIGFTPIILNTPFSFNLRKPSGRPVALEVGSASNRNEYREYSGNILGGKGRPARKADNLTAIYSHVPIV
jgi:hypothetical protein